MMPLPVLCVLVIVIANLVVVGAAAFGLAAGGVAVTPLYRIRVKPRSW